MDEITKLRQQVADLQKELESLVYSVSHDLRAPLRAVQGFAQALSEDYCDKLDGDAQRYLEVIDNSSRQMARMIDALLTLSRLGRQELAVVDVDMKQLVDSLVTELQSKTPLTNVEFRVADLPSVSADPILLRQVWANLLANAVKFTPATSTAKIEVGGRKEPGENVYYVRDNGLGFDMSYAGRLFSLFQRLHSEQNFEGVGAGLAIVRLLVRRHGGRTWAESKPNEGATFFFSLPA